MRRVTATGSRRYSSLTQNHQHVLTFFKVLRPKGLSSQAEARKQVPGGYRRSASLTFYCCFIENARAISKAFSGEVCSLGSCCSKLVQRTGEEYLQLSEG